MLDPKLKQKVIKKYRVHDKDTGSPEVQIAILTTEIKELTRHLKEHRHDFSSRRGLLKKVAERKKLLRYLYRESVDRFEDLIKKLKVKVSQVFIKREEALKELTEQEKALEAKNAKEAKKDKAETKKEDKKAKKTKSKKKTTKKVSKKKTTKKKTTKKKSSKKSKSTKK